MNKKINWIILGITCVVFFFIYKAVFDEKIDLNGDDSSYYILARALAKGKGFVFDCDITQAPHNHFPAGYPFIMSLFMKINGSLGFMKVLNGLFLLGTVVLVYLMQLRLSGNKIMTAIPVILLCITNYYLLKYSVITMSEVPYAFFSIAAVYLYILLKGSEKPFWKDYRFYLLVIASVTTIYIRTMGLSLIVAVALAFALDKKFKVAGIYFVGSLLLYSPWIIRARVLKLGNTYMGQFMSKNPYDVTLGQIEAKDLWDRWLENVDRYISMEIPESVFPYLNIGFDETGNAAKVYWVGVVSIIVFLFFVFKFFKTNHLVIALYIVSTFGIILLWPTQWHGVRFMLPLVPLIYLVLVNSIDGLVSYFSKDETNKVGGYIVAGVCAFLLILAIRKNKEDDPNIRHSISFLIQESKVEYSGAYKNFFEVAKYCKEHLPATSSIGSRKSTMFAMFSDGYTSNFPNTPDPVAFDNYFKTVKYIVVDQFGYTSTGKYLVPYIQSHAQDFELVVQYPEPDTYLFKYNK